MKKLIVFLFILPFMALTISCNEVNRKCSCDNNAGAIVVENISGTMVLDCRTSMWGISHFSESMIDEENIYLFEIIDKEFQIEGLQVSFSGTVNPGKYYSAKGGLSYFCVLETANIKAIE